MDKNHVVVYVMEAISYLVPAICVPLGIYGNALLYRERKSMYVKKRSPIVLFGLNFTFIAAMIVFTITQVVYFYLGDLATAICSIILFIIWWMFLYFLLCKNWMIYYKYHWVYYSIQYEWIQIINSKVANKQNEKNWFIQNNSKYGNETYIRRFIRRLIIIGFIICLIATYLTLGADNTLALFVGAISCMTSLATPIIIYYVIVRKTPSINDIFHIHAESKQHSRGLLIIIISYLAIFLCIRLMRHAKGMAFGTPFYILGLYYMNHASTFAIIKKNMHTQAQLHQAKSDESDATSDITLEMMLTHQTLLHLFMIHLGKELSVVSIPVDYYYITLPLVCNSD